MIDVTIKFWPPEFEFNSGDISYEDNEESQELKTPTYGVIDLITSYSSDLDSLKASDSWDWVSFAFGIPEFITGFESSKEWWTIALPFGAVSYTHLTLPTN